MEPEALKKLVEEAVRDTQAFPWVTFIVAVVAGGAAYLGSYLRTKGENLATKEDVAELTNRVEKVRSQYAERLETLAHQNRMLLEQTSREHQLRMAALERRLQAHQEAFTLWRKLLFSVHTDKISEAVGDCQNWWDRNCLYLDPESREAFVKAFRAAHMHRELIAGRLPAEEIKANFATITSACDAILRGAALPPIKDLETEGISPAPANKQT